METIKVSDYPNREEHEEHENEQLAEDYDLSQLSDAKIGEKKEKEDLGGKTVKIAEVELKRMSEIRETKDGNKYHPVIFRVIYSTGSYENYGGSKDFIRTDGSTSGPTIWADGNNAAAQLFKKYLEFVGKKPSEISYKDFFQGLIGKTVKIMSVNTMYQGTPYRKNIVSEFIKK